MDSKQWKRERSQWASRLEKWHSPRDFRDALDALRAEYGKLLLAKAEFTSLFRDAYTASVFTSHFNPEKVRLINAERPDFEIEMHGRTQMYEVVEADTPGRRRSDEIKQYWELATGKLLPDGFYLTAELASEILEIAVGKKDRDIYLPEWGLVILLNPAKPGGREQQVIEEAMAQSTARVKDRFAEVWVLWEGAAYNLWCRGLPGNGVMRPPDTHRDAKDVPVTPLSALFNAGNEDDE
ncbi:MAG TPA: hypothetical protein VGN83_27310 [Falsiroseomonas sp.]|jgi:hypothetical protein|nr:hypothetical protein [Falsiroseomonas sp.]